MPIRKLSIPERQLRIRTARLARKLSIDDIALRTGIERTRVWRAERGYLVLPEAELASLEATLGEERP